MDKIQFGLNFIAEAEVTKSEPTEPTEPTEPKEQDK